MQTECPPDTRRTSTEALPDTTPPKEAQRARVRRLLIDPLTRLGMCWPRKVRPSDGQAALDGICDDLAYLSDDALRVLAEGLRAKGQGTKRNQWPSRVALLTWAEALEPRPLNMLPSCLRWFASRAGPAALAEGRHVAEYLYWQRAKAPPVTPMQRDQVRRDGQDMQARLALLQERRARGVRLALHDAEWLDWYLTHDRQVTELIRKGSQA